jgi:geranylgeranyl reductase
MMMQAADPSRSFDVVVVGGGPAGATAAADLARVGRTVLLLDREGRTKPCGGAVPARLLTDFAVPESQLKARVGSARMIGPSGLRVDMAVGGSFVGMVDRADFDPWLRKRAAEAGAQRVDGAFTGAVNARNGGVEVSYTRNDGVPEKVAARMLVGADGANSAVRRAVFAREERPPYVFAYHEIVRSPGHGARGFDARRSDVHYDGRVSPDFYGWVFPHGETTSVGVGSAVKGFDFRAAAAVLREKAGLEDQETIRSEGAPLPLKPLKRWDNGRNVLLAGDAAGAVAPSSGEGIWYAMLCGRLAAEAAGEFLDTANPRALATARARFMRDHGRIFMVLRFMQGFWYSSDRRRERFVAICRDADVQRLIWESYQTKAFVRADPMAHVRVFLKDLGHLFRMAFQ